MQMIIAQARLRGAPQLRGVEFDADTWRVLLDGREHASASVPWDVPTSGDVYGAAFNLHGAIERLGDAVHQPPYVAPPSAPVLYIKPVNTWIGAGMPVIQPPDLHALRMGGALGLVIGRTASRVSEAQALEFIGGYTVVNDVSAPHEDFYRPAIREKCRDTFCSIGPWVVSAEKVRDPSALVVRTFINNALRLETRMNMLVRSIPRLIADITAFMTLSPGDVLLPAVSESGPLAGAGDLVAIEIPGVGRLDNPIIRANAAQAGGVQ